MERPEKLKEAIEEGKNIGPRTVMVSPTDKCNLNCKTCWRRDKDQEEFEEGLSMRKIKEVLRECEELGVEKIDFTGGGEPFMRDEIFEILETAKSMAFEAGLTTNSTLLDRKRIERLVDIGLDEILFSVDGLEKTKDYLRGEGTFPKIKKVAEIYEQLSEEATVGFSSVISNENYDELIDIVKLAENLGLDYVNFTLMNVWESNEEYRLKEKNSKKIHSELKKIKDFEGKNGVDTNIENILKHGIFDRSPPKFCFAPWEMAFINASGEVMACCTLASYYKNLLGNIKEESFLSIWRGDKLKKFRKEMAERNFHEKCRECLPDFVERYNSLYERMVEEYEFKN